jgi:hypothetical protein
VELLDVDPPLDPVELVEPWSPPELDVLLEDVDPELLELDPVPPSP